MADVEKVARAMTALGIVPLAVGRDAAAGGQTLVVTRLVDTVGPLHLAEALFEAADDKRLDGLDPWEIEFVSPQTTVGARVVAAMGEREAAALRLSIGRKVGMYGAAYDGPTDARAYTYKHQPGNVPAWKMGVAVADAIKEPAGDPTDIGLALLKHLEQAGFGVFALVENEHAASPRPEAVGEADVTRALADLRHAYSHMVGGRVKNVYALARGLIGPAIERIERAAAIRSGT